MHRTFVNSVCPPHQKVCDVDNNSAVYRSSGNPVVIRGEDFKALVRVLEEEGETFIVGMGAKADFFVGVEFGEGLWIGSWWVADQSCDTAGMCHKGIEVVFWKCEGEGKESKEVSGQLENLTDVREARRQNWQNVHVHNISQCLDRTLAALSPTATYSQLLICHPARHIFHRPPLDQAQTRIPN